MEFNLDYELDPIITQSEAKAKPQLIASRLALFILWVYPRLRGRGREDAHPRTDFNNYANAIVRVFKRDHQVDLPRASLFEPALKGLLRSFKEIYGSQARSPHCWQPMLSSMWRRIEELPAGTPLPGRPPWDPSSHDDLTLLRLGRVLWRSGHRIGEIVCNAAGEPNFITRGCVTYLIRGVILRDPSPAQLRLMKVGDLVYLAPCASKSDQFGKRALLPLPLRASVHRPTQLCRGFDQRPGA